jgi:hypothetical protein
VTIWTSISSVHPLSSSRRPRPPVFIPRTQIYSRTGFNYIRTQLNFFRADAGPVHADARVQTRVLSARTRQKKKYLFIFFRLRGPRSRPCGRTYALTFFLGGWKCEWSADGSIFLTKFPTSIFEDIRLDLGIPFFSWIGI